MERCAMILKNAQQLVVNKMNIKFIALIPFVWTKTSAIGELSQF